MFDAIFQHLPTLRYGYYGNTKSSPTPYDEIHSEYARFDASERVHNAIKKEVEAARKDAALFDCSAFGKVHELIP